MPKKVLFIIDHLGCGGAEKVTIELADYMARQGHDVTLAVLNGKKDYFKTPASIHYIDLGFSDFFAHGKLWNDRFLTETEQQILQQLLAQQFDLIIPEYNNGHWLRPYLSGNVWHWVHGDLIEKRPTHSLFKKIKENLRVSRYTRKFVKLLDGANIVTVSQHLTDKYRPLLPNAKIITIHNGVDQKKLLEKSKETKFDNHWDVIFVGRLHKIKQVDHAIKAFANSGLSGRMAIVGDGPERKNLEFIVANLAIQDRIDFLGELPNPAPYITHSKCLVMTSFTEGGFVPLSIAEALSLNIPVVVYNFSHSVEQYFNSCDMSRALVSPQNIKILADQLYHIVYTPYPIPLESQKLLSIHDTYLNFMQLTD